MFNWVRAMYRLKIEQKRRRIVQIEKDMKEYQECLDKANILKDELECKLRLLKKEHLKINQKLKPYIT